LKVSRNSYLLKSRIREKYWEARKNGLCGNCRRKKALKDLSLCKKCLKKQRNQQKERSKFKPYKEQVRNVNKIS